MGRQELAESVRPVPCALVYDDVARWRATLDSQPEMICRFLPDSTLTFVNRAYAAQYGCEPDDLVGTSILDRFPAAFRTWAEGHILALCTTKQPVTHENTVTTPDGATRFYQWSDHAVLTPDGEVFELQAVGRDVTERRVAEDRLRVSEQRFRAMFDLAPIGMAVVDPLGRIQRANAALADLVAADAPGLVGKRFDELLHGMAFDAWARTALTDGEGIVQAERRLRGDADTWALLSASTFDDDALLVQVVDLTGRKRIEAELAHRAQHDNLTGLPNRAALEAGLRDSLEQASVSGEDVAVLFCDLDRFKLVNDSLGHRGGDQLLLAVSRRLQASVRSGDLLARFGGDEFVIVQRGHGAAATAVTHAERIARGLDVPVALDGTEVPVGMTIGVAVAPGGTGVAAELVRDADLAMYAAKHRERGTVRVCDARLRDAATTRLRAQSSLRRAIDEDELVLHWQPIVRRGGRDLAGLEALVRWQNPDRGLLLPGEFLPDAEDSGLIRRLGDWVLRNACEHLATLRAQGLPPDVAAWVNISGTELADPELPARIRDATARTGLGPGQLVLEISERALLEEADGQLEAVDALGVALALDDVGTGRTSAADLVGAPLDVVKIDRSFVLAMCEDAQAHAVVVALMELARAVDARVVAEGVETEAHAALLEALGADYLQGFGMGRPAPLEALLDRLALPTQG